MNSKSFILLKIKEYKKFKSNVEFAAFLGVSPQLISKWASRETFDIDILYSKLPELSPDWLLTGEGEMLRGDSDSAAAKNEEEMSALRSELRALRRKEMLLMETNRNLTEMLSGRQGKSRGARKG